MTRHPDRLTNAKTPVLLEIRGAAGHEPSRERAHETDERHKRAEVIFHVFQLLIESSPLVLKEALTLAGPDMNMKKWTAADLPDLTGKTAVATGASSGIGLVIARQLARSGASVVLAVRDVNKGRTVAEGTPGQTEVRQLDVADLSSVRGFADSWSGSLDILVPLLAGSGDRGMTFCYDTQPCSRPAQRDLGTRPPRRVS